LRIACQHPIGLIETPLIVKRGGHSDQLSSQPGLDRYRIQSLVKIIGSQRLTADQRKAALEMLRAKCTIYAAGCRKRGRREDAEHYEKLAKQAALDIGAK
jgi:hypothetical protein